MAYNFIQKPSRDRLVELLGTRTNAEVAAIYGCNTKTIVRWKKEYGITYYNSRYACCPDRLSDCQAAALDGVLLGGAMLRGVKNAYLRVKQCSAHREYVSHLRELFRPFSNEVRDVRSRIPARVDGKISNSLDHWDGRWTSASCFQTHCHPLFTVQWRRWYVNGRKIIPADLILSWRSIAYWYADDGNNNQARKTVTLCANNFTVDEVERLVSMLGQKGVICHRITRNDQSLISVGKKSYFEFLDQVRPFFPWSCFSHKVDTSKTRATREGWGGYKLSMNDARTIRKMYETDRFTQKQLAAVFGVSQGMIGRIINNKAHVDHAFGFGGESGVSVHYNLV